MLERLNVLSTKSEEKFLGLKMAKMFKKLYNTNKVQWYTVYIIH